MAWTGLALTVEGRNALNQAQLSNTINFKSIVVGDGKAPANFGTQKGLVHQLYEITDIKVDVIDGGCTITADFPKMEYDYYFREIGIIVTADTGDILYVYDNCGDDAQYIVGSTGVETTKKRIRLSLAISDVEEIMISEPQILYVSYDDYEESVNRLDTEIENNKIALEKEITRESERAEKTEQQLKKDIDSEVTRATEAEDELRQQKLDADGDASDVTVDFRESEDLILLDGLHKLSELFGASAKAVSSLIAHLEDKNNPHEVSREQMQVDKVDNTSDMEKPVSTAQQAALDALHAQLAAYTDKAVADLINGAPSTLDTLGEIARAMAENADVVSALNEAIGKKANEAEFDSHVKDTTAHVTAADRETWKTVAQTNSPSANADYRVLLSGTADDITRMEGTRKSGNLTYDPATKTLKGDSIELRSANNTDGRSAKISGDGMHLFMPEYGYSGGIGYMQGNKLVGVMGRWKEGDRNYYFCGENYDNPNGTFRAGKLEAGDKASLFTDNEGGNIRLSAPDGTVWEADAYNGGYRVFTYANGVKEGFTIDVMGQVWMTNGLFAKNIGYVGNTMYAQIGCGAISLYGHVYTYMLANAVIAKLTGTVGERYYADDYDWNVGINLTAILNTFKLDTNLNLQTSQVQFFLPDGRMHAHAFGYSSFFVQKSIGTDKILTPARFYTIDGAIGEWASSFDVYAPGTIWIAELILM